MFVPKPLLSKFHHCSWFPFLFPENSLQLDQCCAVRSAADPTSGRDKGKVFPVTRNFKKQKKAEKRQNTSDLSFNMREGFCGRNPSARLYRSRHTNVAWSLLYNPEESKDLRSCFSFPRTQTTICRKIETLFVPCAGWKVHMREMLGGMLQGDGGVRLQLLGNVSRFETRL